MKYLTIMAISLLFIANNASATANSLKHLKEKMDYLSNKQLIITQNISNSNTPYYKSKDIKRIIIGKHGLNNQKLLLSTSSAKHLNPKSANKFKVIKINPNFSYKKNDVVLENETRKLSDINSDYNMTTTTYKKMLNLVRIATSAR